jgi:hypothetical protein
MRARAVRYVSDVTGRPRQDSNLRTRLRSVLGVAYLSAGRLRRREHDGVLFPRSSRRVDLMPRASTQPATAVGRRSICARTLGVAAGYDPAGGLPGSKLEARGGDGVSDPRLVRGRGHDRAH